MRLGKYIAMLFLALTSRLALAQNVFEPSKDDVMVKIIGQVFGGITPGGGADAFGSSISTFNAAILIIGGILATYTLLAGTLGTAHDGEMLGKKFSSMWIPIRYSLGTALVIPVVGGYAVIQKLMMWIIIQGIGLGGAIWGAYMDKPYQQANTVIQTTTKYQVQELAEKIYLSQICVQANAAAVKSADSILSIFTKVSYGVSYNSKNMAYEFGDQNGSLLGAGSDACGSVQIAEPVANTTLAQGPTTSNLGYLGPLDDLFSPADISPINKAHETATKTLIDRMGALATLTLDGKEVDNAKANELYGKITSSSEAYIATIQAAAAATQVQKDTTDRAKNYGFSLAGAYFMNIIVTNSKITTAVGSIPVASPKTHNYSSTAQAASALGTKVVATGNKAYSGGAMAQAGGSGKEADMSWDGKVVNAITKYFTHLDFYNLKNDARHPIIILSDMGNTLITAYTAVLMAVLGITVVGGAAAALIGTISPMGAVITGTISNTILTVLGFLGIPMLMVLGSAFVAAYLIPMMVFIMWIGILVGYALGVVIAIIISPLWIVMHLHPNGDDLTGKGASGYMMVLTMLLKPSFMIFGFIAAIALSSILGEFINKIYFQVFSFSQGDGNGLMGFMKTVFGSAIYIGLMFIFIKKCFSLMGSFSDEIFKWIGGHGTTLGSSGEAMQAGSTGAFAGAAGLLGAKGIADGIQGGAKKVMDKIGQGAKDKIADKEKDTASDKPSMGSSASKAMGQSFNEMKKGMSQMGASSGASGGSQSSPASSSDSGASGASDSGSGDSGSSASDSSSVGGDNQISEGRGPARPAEQEQSLPTTTISIPSPAMSAYTPAAPQATAQPISGTASTSQAAAQPVRNSASSVSSGSMSSTPRQDTFSSLSQFPAPPDTTKSLQEQMQENFNSSNPFDTKPSEIAAAPHEIKGDESNE